MDSKDKYINLELQKILDQYITNEKYQEFKPVLDEIFQRRAFEFDFSLDRMTQDLKNFTTNVDKIEMVPSEEFEKRYGGSENTLGLFDIKGKKIALNIGLIEKDSKVLINKFLGDPAFDVEFVKNQIGQMILKALTHEAYHAMSDKDRLMYYNQYNIKSGIYLDEVFVESEQLEQQLLKEKCRYFKDMKKPMDMRILLLQQVCWHMHLVRLKKK